MPPFPPTPRVLYGTTPLEEVVCQLRFPPILRIDTEPPAAFQERIRTTFPLYERTASPPPVALSLPPPLAQALAMGGGIAHEFITPDRAWKLSLTRDFVALTTREYKEWSEFKAKLQTPLEALIAVYAPAFFVRVGLRYRDRVDRQKFGLNDVPWSELLRAEALGELADGAIGPQVRHILRELVVELTESAGFVRIVHGLESLFDKSMYLIDSDFFTENRVETGAVTNVLDAFNRRAGHLFRWYITPRLHDAMEPREAPAPG